MKSYIQGLITGGLFVFTLMVLVGHTDYSRHGSESTGRYTYNFSTDKETEDLIEIFDNKKELDEMIQSFAEEYPVNQLSIVDKSLLRLAFWEVKKLKKSDNFSKLVEDFEKLGYLFGSDNSNKFIKGVLKSLIKNLDKIYYKTKWK